MGYSTKSVRARLMIGAAVGALVIGASPALAQESSRLDLAPQSLASALYEFGRQTGHQVIFSPELTRAKTTQGVSGNLDEQVAMAQLLAGTGLTFRHEGNTYMILGASDPQSGSAAGDGADAGTVQALIVTAQKREENIQDVPIAMSAFTQEDLTRSQVTGGPDLMTQVPNFTFTKTNFTSYSIQIRGIGTQAISATVDPAVAVAFNNTPFLRAHFFEQEFYDLERVEVLRGPQGTLYGRNATAGVVNLISAKPKFHFEAKASADISNYSSHRLEGMLNLPLVEDKVALRIAGAWTKRDGYTDNEITGRPIDGRDLWSTRLSLRTDPTEHLSANFIWEHFEEDDDRLRSGKQLCKTDPVPTGILGVSVADADFRAGIFAGAADPSRYLSQGCAPASLYSPDSFQVPNGHVLGYYLPLGSIGLPLTGQQNIYENTVQNRDLRVIQSEFNPKYRALSDTVELNLDYDISPGLTVSSQTGYNRDFVFSTEDYNRFSMRHGAFLYEDPNAPASQNQYHTFYPSALGMVYNPHSADPALRGLPCDPAQLDPSAPSDACITPGVFCDPQVGCSDRLVLIDLATARSRQFSQEVRIASNFDGPFNFSLGANYLRYKTLEDYYVFINSITITMSRANVHSGIWNPGVSDNSGCLLDLHGFDLVSVGMVSDPQTDTCGYIDPNPIDNLNGQGHNYFRNQNPYKVQSYAAFGEAYYNITPDLKLTAGLRWTVDKKDFHSIPSELLVAGYGYPEYGEIKQTWREPTGRLVLTWTPHIGFTDQTMVYGSYTHGYKAGGANPPGAVLLVNRGGDIPFPTHPATFDPEFVDAYEMGTKNTLLDGRLTANVTAFYYDYTGYQISEIVDRSAINLNFDAKIWGAELETDWRPLENLRFGLKVGYENTRLADGSKAVDLMDRTAGHEDWMVVKPFPTQASNCILPTETVAWLLINSDHQGNMATACTNAYLGKNGQLLDPITGFPYQQPVPTTTFWAEPVPSGYPGFNPETAPNRGAGFDKDLSGHALPNAPKYTATLTADYTVPLPQDWLLTLHGDFYQQSEAWTRVFNDPGYDKLKAYNNVNLAAIFSNEDRGWTVMAYVKNVLDKDNITGAFLNSDDTGLTTNVFLNEPRLYGLRVTKNWTNSPWWGTPASGIGPHPLTVELEGYHGDIGDDQEVHTPSLATLFSENLRFPSGVQRDLAAGNGGGIRITWQPSAVSWNLSAGIRYGRAGGGTRVYGKENPPDTCRLIFPGGQAKYCGNPGDTPLSGAFAERKYGWHSYFNASSQVEEGHDFADFAVGREFGVGRWRGQEANTTISAGLAYGRFDSSVKTELHGAPDMYFSSYGLDFNTFTFGTAHFHSFDHRLDTNREFDGAGPELAIEAELPLIGASDRAGRVALDAGLGGTVLFGRQKTSVNLQMTDSYSTGDPLRGPRYNGTVSTSSAIERSRSHHATVPGVSANLGLSYTLGGMELRGGYRMERYYDAIDGGLGEHKSYDRTIDGPYFKVSVGFGG